MEECVRLGLTKSIGVSNFNEEQIDRLLKNCKIKPVVNQVEVNPNLNQKKLIQFCKERDIIITGYCPLGRSEYAGTPGFPNPTIFDPKVIEMGKKYNKTPAQIVLNYLVSPRISCSARENILRINKQQCARCWYNLKLNGRPSSKEGRENSYSWFVLNTIFQSIFLRVLLLLTVF